MDKGVFVHIEAWFTDDCHANVEVKRMEHGKRMNRKSFTGVSRASVDRLIRFVYPLRPNVQLSVNW